MEISLLTKKFLIEKNISFFDSFQIVNCSPLSQVVDFVKNPTDALNCVRATEKWYNQMTGNRLEILLGNSIHLM